MAVKLFALLSVFLVAASCFYNADGWMRRSTSSPITITYCVWRYEYVCYGPPEFICVYEYRCVTITIILQKRSVTDDGIIECVPTKLSEMDCDEDGRVSYREFVVALTLDESNDTSRRAFEDGDKNGQFIFSNNDYTTVNDVCLYTGDKYLNAVELRNMAAKNRYCLQKQRRHRQVLDSQLPGNFELYDRNNNGEIDGIEFSDQVNNVHNGTMTVNSFGMIMKKIAGCKNLSSLRYFIIPLLHILPYR